MLGDAAGVRVCGCLGSTSGRARTSSVTRPFISGVEALGLDGGPGRASFLPGEVPWSKGQSVEVAWGPQAGQGAALCPEGREGQGSPFHGPLGAVTTPDLMEGRGAVGKGWGPALLQVE